MIKAGIVGGTGYTGVELLRLLALHPAVELAVITSRGEKGVRVSELFPNLRGRVDLAFVEPDDAVLKGCDVVFFATPNGTAMKSAPALLEAGVKIIDLAADFRLRRVEDWEQWYGMPHACPELLAEAVYGLPEVNREIDSQRPTDGQSRLLSDRRATGFPAVARSGRGRPAIADRRRQIRGQRRRAQGRSRHFAVRGRRQLQGLRRAGAPPSGRRFARV